MGQYVGTRNFFITCHPSLLCYGHLTHKKYTINISITKTVFSFANSVDASQNTCIVSKKEVPNEYDRKPDSATLGILLYFCNLSQRYGLDIYTRDRHILAKMQKNVMKKHTLKPPTFTNMIMLSSIQPVKIPQKLIDFLIILVESSIFSEGRAEMTKNGVLSQ